jgi:hypothetical protein
MTVHAIPQPDAVRVVRGLLADRYSAAEFDVQLEMDGVTVRWDNRRFPFVDEFEVRDAIRSVERTAA